MYIKKLLCILCRFSIEASGHPVSIPWWNFTCLTKRFSSTVFTLLLDYIRTWISMFAFYLHRLDRLCRRYYFQMYIVIFEYSCKFIVSFLSQILFFYFHTFFAMNRQFYLYIFRLFKPDVLPVFLQNNSIWYRFQLCKGFVLN